VREIGRVRHQEKRIIEKKSTRGSCTYRNGHCECCVVGSERRRGYVTCCRGFEVKHAGLPGAELTTNVLDPKAQLNARDLKQLHLP